MCLSSQLGEQTEWCYNWNPVRPVDTSDLGQITKYWIINKLLSTNVSSIIYIYIKSPDLQQVDH